MELTLKHIGYGAAIVVALIILYIILFRPAPDVQAGCNFNCNDFIVDTDQYDNWSSSLCGSGHDICCMEKVEYHIAGFKIYCTCCDCTEGGVTTDLGTCNYGFGLFDYLGAMIGMCEPAG